LRPSGQRRHKSRAFDIGFTRTVSRSFSAASLVEIEAVIGRVPASQQARTRALQDWIDGLASAFSDRIHPVDASVALRAGRLLPHCHIGFARHRFHDAVLVATAQTHGHGLLTRRDAVFGAWTKVVVASV
jgi:hypothetical protein